MSQIRVSRMEKEIREQVSEILSHRLSDPRLAWISVVRVELSKDLRYAKLYVSVLGGEEKQDASLRVLARARAAVRAELSHRLHVRKAPEIEFRADHSIEHSVRIQQTLRELGFTDGASGEGGSPEEPPVQEER